MLALTRGERKAALRSNRRSGQFGIPLWSADMSVGLPPCVDTVVWRGLLIAAPGLPGRNSVRPRMREFLATQHRSCQPPTSSSPTPLSNRGRATWCR